MKIIPIFIPHAGCPYKCIYCDQRKISGTLKIPGKMILATFAMLIIAQVSYALFGKGIEFFPSTEPENVSISVHAKGNLSIDEKGLDHSDQMFLKILCEKFNGGPVGLSTMAAAMSEEENTIEDMIEPFLIREGFLKKTPRGRMATGAGFAHAGVKNKLQSSNMNF